MSTAAGVDPELLASVAARALLEITELAALHNDRVLRVGLGTGRAAEAFIKLLGQTVRALEADVEGVPTSERSEALALAEGITLGTLADGPLDIAFDGADEVDPALQLTKGLGGAMLRERVVAAEASRFVVLVTAEKVVSRLGSRSPLPIEVIPFARASAARRLSPLGSKLELRSKRENDEPFITDNGNLVYDLYAPSSGWEDSRQLDATVRAIPGVVDTGFFFGLASIVIVGGPDGTTTLHPAPKAGAR